MRPFVFVLAGLIAGFTFDAALAGPPSAIRARQMYGGTPFRKVQDTGDSPGPQLLQPQLAAPSEEPAGEPPAGARPTPTFSDDPAEGEGGPRLTPFPTDPRGVEPPAGGPALPNGVAAATQDFWIVSSRNCLQQGTGETIDCRLEYFRCDGRNRRVRASEPAFCQSLPPGVPVCIVVHGSFTDWNTVCEDACATQRWLRAAAPQLPLQMVFYSWPSDAATTVLPPLDIGIMGTRAEFNGLYLAQLIQRIPPQSPVSFIGHSHGARAITSCLHALAGGPIQGYRFPSPQTIPHRVRAVYMAGAIDHHWLLPGERYSCALRRADAILNVRNCEDWALAFYPWRRPFAGVAIGREGLSQADRAALGPLANKVCEVDVAPLMGDAHLWPHYLSRPEISAAAIPYVYFEGQPGAGSTVLRPAPRPGTAGGGGGRGGAPHEFATRRPASANPPLTGQFRPAGDPYRNSAHPPAQPYLGTTTTTPPGAMRPATSPAGTSPWRPATASPQASPNRSLAPTGGFTPWTQTRPSMPRSPTPNTSPAPATLLPPQSSVAPQFVPPQTAPGSVAGPALLPPKPPGGSLTPIERGPAGTPQLEETQPVHIDESPFERPRRPLPSILRKYYPEAHRSQTPPEV